MAISKSTKKFREKYKQAKKLGLVSGPPANQVFPGTREGKKLKSKVESWDDVLSGKATALDIPKSQRKKLLKQMKRDKRPAEIHEGKLVVGHEKGERAFYDTKNKSIGFDLGKGISEIDIDADTGKAFAKQLDKLPTLRQDQFYGFKFFGNNGTRYFRNGDLMRKFLAEYKGKHGKRAFAEGADTISGIRIFQLDRAEMERRELKYRK